jgi:hypothetical protein
MTESLVTEFLVTESLVTKSLVNELKIYCTPTLREITGLAEIYLFLPIPNTLSQKWHCFFKKNLTVFFFIFTIKLNILFVTYLFPFPPTFLVPATPGLKLLALGC